jgi:D-inositol-3-phosphate glycosyltransferase
MRICFVLEYYYPHVGGAEVLFQHLAEGLVKAGHACDVVTCRLPGTRMDEEINGVRVHRVPVPRIGDRYWFTVLAFAATWRYAREVDVVHTMTYNGALPAWLVSRFRKKPVVMLAHEVIGSKWHSIGLNPVIASFYRFIEYAVLRIPFDVYSCNSMSTMRSLQSTGIPAQKLFLAYPGIDYALFDPRRELHSRDSIRRRLGIQDDRFLYTFYGRPGYVKGIQHLVAAVPLIKKIIPRATLLLILSRKPVSGHHRIQEMVQNFGLVPGEDIIIRDPVPRPELPSFIAASDCVVVPSLSEGFGFTCVEACAMKRPVVATTAGSLPEVVSGRYVLVEPGSADALADGIVRISRKDYSQSEEKRFHWEEHVRKHEKVYRDLLKERGPC